MFGMGQLQQLAHIVEETTTQLAEGSGICLSNLKLLLSITDRLDGENKSLRARVHALEIKANINQ